MYPHVPNTGHANKGACQSRCRPSVLQRGFLCGGQSTPTRQQQPQQHGLCGRKLSAACGMWEDVVFPVRMSSCAEKKKKKKVVQFVQGRIQGGYLGARPPCPQDLFLIMQFSGFKGKTPRYFEQILGSAPSPLRVKTPRCAPDQNPGSCCFLFFARSGSSGNWKHFSEFCSECMNVNTSPLQS